MKTSRKKIGSIVGIILVLGGVGWGLYSTGRLDAYRMHMDSEHMHGDGGMMAHDMGSMPGLKGTNATDQESADLGVMFQNFQTFSREVTNLPNGIRTVTRSSDPDVMAVLINHVTGMIGRVEEGDDPKIFIQSPTLDIFFQRGDRIVTTIDITDAGIVVDQISDDPELVAALHTHAAEVSAMAERGMQAVHEMMAARAGN